MVKTKTQQRRSFFDVTKTIINTKDFDQMEADISSQDFKSIYTSYMILRYLSMTPEFLDIIKSHQSTLESMDRETQYRFLMKVIPQRRNLWTKYISKGKKKSTKK